jgi:hypothetical protein
MTATEFIKENYTLTNGGEDYICNHSGQLVGIEDIAEEYHQAKLKLLRIYDVIDSGNYSIATIRRKSDNKLFSCFFRNGSVKIIKDGDMLNYKHWFIEKKTGGEEICLYGVDQKVYDIIEVVVD